MFSSTDTVIASLIGCFIVAAPSMAVIIVAALWGENHVSVTRTIAKLFGASGSIVAIEAILWFATDILAGYEVGVLIGGIAALLVTLACLFIVLDDAHQAAQLQEE